MGWRVGQLCDTWKNLDWRSWIKFSVVEICGKFSAGSGSAINKSLLDMMSCLYCVSFLSRKNILSLFGENEYFHLYLANIYVRKKREESTA